jgi:TM2 domain-containing membrane protein YozV
MPVKSNRSAGLNVEWYYIGHYGQLGPLSREQMDELIEGGVILSDTYVWKSGMAQWLTADMVGELQAALRASAPFVAPPPPPMAEPPRPQAPAPRPVSYSSGPQFGQQQRPDPRPMPQPSMPPAGGLYYQGGMSYPVTRSDRSRVWAGVLQLFFPGVGRMYLGYYAIGTLQLIFALCSFGLFHLWSMIDGIVILAGGVKFDGFGRVLAE